jgi:hypothetical protein
MRYNILALIACLVAGCASKSTADDDSRQLAQVAYQQLLTMHQQLQLKMDAENQFYRDQAATMDRTLTRLDEIEREKVRNQLGREFIELLGAVGKDGSKPLDVNELSKRLGKKKNAQLEAAKKRNEDRRVRLAAKLESMKQLESLSADYAKAQQTLIALSRKPEKSELARSIQFLQRTYKHYKELEKRDADDSGAGGTGGEGEASEETDSTPPTD